VQAAATHLYTAVDSIDARHNANLRALGTTSTPRLPAQCLWSDIQRTGAQQAADVADSLQAHEAAWPRVVQRAHRCPGARCSGLPSQLFRVVAVRALVSVTAQSLAAEHSGAALPCGCSALRNQAAPEQDQTVPSFL